MDKMILSEENRYELTIEYVKSIFVNNFYDDGVLLNRIKANSRKIYNYIYSHSFSSNRITITKLLNNTKSGFNYILDALVSQFEADLETGYNDLTKQPGINVKNGQVINRKEMFINQISPDTEQILDNSKGYFKGINILYQGQFRIYNWEHFL